eukprot:TRINITY_DN2933_c0_g2_i1.p1 TRINITY_DN2933_c0_g2~~TRINITY_DN2933_c0_g2_i1.p1  ORF type:complete len:150 (-),score=30.02 TRINITY_DN2933_c0_g2_i1:188-637(-)
MSNLILKTEVGGFKYTLFLTIELHTNEDGTSTLQATPRNGTLQQATISKEETDNLWAAADKFGLFSLPQSPSGEYDDLFHYSITLHVNHQGKSYSHISPESCDQLQPEVEATDAECDRFLGFCKHVINLMESRTSVLYPQEMKRRWPPA